MSAFFSVVSYEWQQIVTSPTGWKITATHLIIVALAALLGWPTSYILGEAHWAPTLAWWAYAEVLILSYLALAVPAHLFSPIDAFKPGYWILYANASPSAFLAGQTVATLGAVGFWLLTTTPILILGLSLRPLALELLMTLLLYIALLVIMLSQFGTWLATVINALPYRTLAVDIGYLLLMVVSFAFHPNNSLIPQIHPLAVVSQIIQTSPQEALATSAAGRLVRLAAINTPPIEPPPPTLSTQIMLIVLYTIMTCIGSILALLTLRQWQRRYTDQNVSKGQVQR